MSMRICHIICVSVFVLIGFASVTSALPHAVPEPPGVSEPISSTLIIYCDTSDEFDPAPTIAGLNSEAQNVPSPLEDGQNAAPRVAIPEPSTLVLLGLGLLGMLRFTGIPKK